MKKVLVLGSLSTQANETRAIAGIASFVEQAVGTYSSNKVNAYFCHFDDLGYIVRGVHDYEIVDLRNKRDLAEYDLVFFRGKIAGNVNLASIAGQYLRFKNTPHVNTAYGDRRAIGKIPQLYNMAELGMPVPSTVSAKSEFLRRLVEEHLAYPIIVKDVKGSHGSHNYLVHDGDQLDEILAQNPALDFMAQKFIPNEGDYRVLIIGESVAIIHRKSSGDSHLNNTSVGGTATLADAGTLSPDIIEQSKRFAKQCGYEIAGVDVIVNETDGSYYFLEINSQPQLQTGAFLAEKQDMMGKFFNQLLA